jgi:uncharacterized membrane protein
MANYLIIGGDGKQYGPVTDADVRQWIAEGRLNGISLAKGESDAEFRPLAQFPEFAVAFGPSGAAPATIGPIKSSTAFLERDYELDLGGCISRGYQLLKDNFNLLFVTALVFFGIEGLIAALGAIPFVGPIFSLVNMVIAGPLVGGLFYVNLRAVRGESAEVGDIFAGFRKHFGQLFLGKLVPGLIAALCLIPVIIAAVVLVVVPAVAQHNQPPDWHKLLLLIPILFVCLLPVIFLQTCWTFTLPLIIDKGMDFGAAMKASWKMVRKHWWQVFGLMLLIGLVNIAGLLACFVGLLFTMPIGFAAMMIAYETIFGEKN